MKIAIITGASSGMGRETAVQLSDRFGGLSEIWIAARRGDRLDALEDVLPVPVRKFAIDLTKPDELNVLSEALRAAKPDVRILVNASGYGKIGPAGGVPLEEETGMVRLNCEALLAVTHIALPYMGRGGRILQYASSAAFLPQPGFAVYAATKACQNMIGSIYAKAYGMEIILVRAFNHVGPGQAPIFVVSDFCKQTAEIEMGLREPLIRVGNLSARRDFTDVRDVVRAYGLLSLKGTAGETYNVGSGTAIKIRQILDLIVGMSSAKIGVEVDPAKIRPVDVPVIEADIIKITKATGWKPVISIEQTIKETLDYWRKR